MWGSYDSGCWAKVRDKMQKPLVYPPPPVILSVEAKQEQPLLPCEVRGSYHWSLVHETVMEQATVVAVELAACALDGVDMCDSYCDQEA